METKNKTFISLEILYTEFIFVFTQFNLIRQVGTDLHVFGDFSFNDKIDCLP